MPTPIVYFDLETTGLPHGGHLPDIIQIGAVDSYNQQEQIIYSTINYFTVGKNIIATIKMLNNFCYPLKWLFFQYCDSNIGLFSIAPH